MKVMASRGATRPVSAARCLQEGPRARGPVAAVLWLALPGVAALALGAALPTVVPVSRAGLAAIGLLLVVAAGGLIARRTVGAKRERPWSSGWLLPARQAGAVPVGGHRAGREARGRVAGVRGGDERGRRAPSRRARPSLTAEQHARKGR